MKSVKMQEVSNQGSPKLRPKRAIRGSTSALDVHGGRIVRSAGRKDRHSKVSTARGLRDRRLRLSPNTAIQFYDVQDRLGYDRPSKAIDWLMNEAKAAIDALNDSRHARGFNDAATDLMPGKGLNGQEESKSLQRACRFHGEKSMNDISIGNFSLFPVENGVAPPSFSTEFLPFSNGHLSLRNKTQADRHSSSSHSGQDCSFLFSSSQEQSLFPDSILSHCQTNSEVGRFQKLMGWNSLAHHYIPSHYDENELHVQREPLQSSFCPTTLDPVGNQFSTTNHHGIRCPDGLPGSSTAGRMQDLAEYNPVSIKSSSATSFLHYLN